MPEFAAPPDLPIVPRNHSIRRQISIQRRMPFSSQLGMYGGQVVEAGQQFLVSAVGTTGLIMNPGIDHRPPFVPPAAHPPGISVAAGKNIGGLPISVLLTPLFCHFGVQGGKVVFTPDRPFSCTVRAAVPGRPGADQCLPLVPFPATPPDVLLRARQAVFRAEA